MSSGLPPRDWLPGLGRGAGPTGRSMAAPRLRWTASPPPGVGGEPRRRPVETYTGPPSYPAPPRWGFPNLAWRRPTMVPGTPSANADPLLRQRALSSRVVAALTAAAMLAGLAGLAELWRYLLLVQSRTSALSRSVVLASDALVVAAAVLASLAGIIAVGMAFWWYLLARAAAADRAGVEPARPAWRTAAAFFVPGLNLVLAGPVVAELEHQILGRTAKERPRPSRLVLSWWTTWVANGVLLLVTVVWRTREGVQAEADSVLLSGVTDLVACALAVLTVLLVTRMSALLSPVPPGTRRMRVLRVSGAPAPPLRPTRPAGSPR